MIRIDSHPVEHLQSFPLDFFSHLCRRARQPAFADQLPFRASMSLNVDRGDIAEDAAVLVRLANLDDLDINRQPFDSRDRLAH